MQQNTPNFQSQVPRERMVWCDVIRLIAFYFLLCCHAADPFYASSAYASGGEVASPELINWAVIWGSFVRPCVPLFVMLTGVLVMPVKMGMTQFYKRRIPRVLFPFVIWSVVYYMTPWLLGLMGFDGSAVRALFSWAETDSTALCDSLDRVVRIPYSFSFIACHMWYIYMLIGLYLYLPVFSAWVERATKKEKEIALLIWAVSTVLPYFTTYVSHYCFGTCEWNAFGLFYYFAGFSGYMLLGHYIKQYVHCRMWVAVMVSLPLLIIGMAVTYSGYSHVMSMPERTPEMVELFWTYNTPNVMMMTLAWFLTLSRVRISAESRVARLLANLTACGFGIYMIHYFFVYLGFSVGEWLRVPAALRIPVSAIIIFACSWLIVARVRIILGNKVSRYLLG
ncbi:MAG: acyltransferase [Muribaculaceae bacterium]